MKNKSLIVVYIIQTQTVSLENIPYFDCIFFVEYHHFSLYTCIYIYIFFLVFIDLKAETFFKRIILEVKFCSISESISFPRTHKNYNVGICLLVGLYSYNIRFSLILAEVLLETKKQHGKIVDMFDLSVHFISIENLTLFILICFVRKANVFSPYV